MQLKLRFLGAARTVTGSCYLLETDGRKVLFDCGMFQGAKSLRNLNFANFLFEPAGVDCVVLTHAHVDHCGLLPKLCKQGFRGPIYATKATVDLCRIMLPDSAHIQEFDAEIANRKGQRAGREAVEPLYTVDDAMASLQQFESVPYGQPRQIAPEISVCFQDAGHILGSAFVEVEVSEEGETTKFVFSGDLGQPNQPIIKDPSAMRGADYILVESTYGDRLHQHYDKEDVLADIIQDTVARGGNVVIPSFAVGRTQTMLYYLHKLWRQKRIPEIPIILDSPLAIAATRIFAQNTDLYDEATKAAFTADGTLPQMPQLRMAETAEASKAINAMEGPAIIISASGMCDAGRILHHLKHNLWRPESSVLFVGYQAEESLGRRLLEGTKRVRIMGEDVSVKAKIFNMDGFSAHADREQVIDWLRGASQHVPAQVFLVHGESMATETLAESIEEQLRFSTYIPSYGDAIEMHGRAFQIEKSEIVVEPAARELEESLRLIEADYRQLRKRILRRVLQNPAKLRDAANKVQKALRYLKKMFSEL